MRHLQAGASESALDVETLIGLAAVEDALVAAHLVGDVVEGLDQAETELLALLVLGNCNVFDVADVAKAVNAIRAISTGQSWCSEAVASMIIRVAVARGNIQLLLDNQRTSADHRVR